MSTPRKPAAPKARKPQPLPEQFVVTSSDVGTIPAGALVELVEKEPTEEEKLALSGLKALEVAEKALKELKERAVKREKLKDRVGGELPRWLSLLNRTPEQSPEAKELLEAAEELRKDNKNAEKRARYTKAVQSVGPREAGRLLSEQAQRVGAEKHRRRA